MRNGFALMLPFLLLIVIASDARAQRSAFGLAVGGGIAPNVIALPRQSAGSQPGLATVNGPYAQVEFLYLSPFSRAVELQLAVGLSRYSGQLIFNWPDRPAEREDLSHWSAQVAPRLALHSLHLPGLPYFFAGPTLRIHGERPHARLLLLQPLEASLNFGLGIQLRVGRLRLRPEFSFDLSLTNRLRGAQTAEHLQAIRGIRRDLIGLRFLLTS